MLGMSANELTIVKCFVSNAVMAIYFILPAFIFQSVIVPLSFGTQVVPKHAFNTGNPYDLPVRRRRRGYRTDLWMIVLPRYQLTSIESAGL